MFKKKIFTYLFVLLFTLLAVHSNVQAQEEYDTLNAVEPPTVAIDSAVAAEGKDQVYTVKSPKGNFKNIYEDSIPVSSQRRIADSVMNRISKDDEFWYVNAVEKPKEYKEDFWDKTFKFLSNDTTRIVVWCLLAVFMLGAIFLYLRDNQIGLFSSSSKKISKEEMDDELMPENIFEIDYEAAITKAVSSSNYRLATRFLFLRTLKTLSSKSIIDYAADRTNFDYLFQISGTKYSALFMNAAKHYEYIWYGKFEVNDEQFRLIKKGFDDFQKQLA